MKWLSRGHTQWLYNVWQFDGRLWQTLADLQVEKTESKEEIKEEIKEEAWQARPARSSTAKNKELNLSKTLALKPVLKRLRNDYVILRASNIFEPVHRHCWRTGERGVSWASLEFIDGRSLRCWDAEWSPRSNRGWRERWRLGWRLGRNGRRRDLWSWPFGRGIWLLTWGCWGCQRKFDDGAM